VFHFFFFGPYGGVFLAGFPVWLPPKGRNCPPMPPRFFFFLLEMCPSPRCIVLFGARKESLAGHAGVFHPLPRLPRYFAFKYRAHAPSRSFLLPLLVTLLASLPLTPPFFLNCEPSPPNLKFLSFFYDEEPSLALSFLLPFFFILIFPL